MVLEDGEEIVLDAMIICTGYKYRFPFLDTDVISTDDEHVSPLYKHMLHLDYHSLMLITVLRNVALYPISFSQAKFARAVIDGVAKLPSRPEMKNNIENEIRYRRENNLTGPMWHHMDTHQWQYDNDLAQIGKFEPISDIHRIFWDFVENHREKDFVNYWKYDYVITRNETIEAVKRQEHMGEEHIPMTMVM